MRALAIALLVVACGPEKEDYTKQKPPEPEPAAPAAKAPPKKVLTAADLGTCHLTASGAVSADQTTNGGRSATNVSYWYSPDELKTMMGVDGFVVNCMGPDISFRIVPGGGKEHAMPFKPKKYDFDKGKGDAAVIVSFGKKTLDNPSGSVDITAFDSHHIAGTIDISGKLGGADEKVTGQFDLVCPGLSKCE